MYSSKSQTGLTYLIMGQNWGHYNTFSFSPSNAHKSVPISCIGTKNKSIHDNCQAKILVLSEFVFG